MFGQKIRFGCPLSLDLGAHDVAVEHVVALEAEELAAALARRHVVGLAALLPALGLEGHLAQVHDGRGQLPGVVLLLHLATFFVGDIY